MFGQQPDERKAWLQHYDLFSFVVQTRSRVKMLHELWPAELGSMIIAIPVLPRYKIGDLIKASPASLPQGGASVRVSEETHREKMGLPGTDS
jgi:hypothetical protein